MIWEITDWYDGRDSYLLGPPPVEDQASCACKLPSASRLLVVPPAEMTFGEVPGQIVPGLSPAAATYTTLDFESDLWSTMARMDFVHAACRNEDFCIGMSNTTDMVGKFDTRIGCQDLPPGGSVLPSVADRSDPVIAKVKDNTGRHKVRNLIIYPRLLDCSTRS